MNIAEILRTHATTTPQAVTIIDTHRRRRRTTTFDQMEQASAQIAGQLYQAGLRPGDTVLVFQPMSAELYIILAAIFRLGLVVMFIDPAQGRAHIEQCCAIQPPQALIAGPKAHLLRFVSPSLRQIPHKFVVAAGGRLEIGGWRFFKLKTHNLKFKTDIYLCSPDTPALLTFTSGSTGRPKAALRTHAFLLAQYQALVDTLQLVAGQVDLSTMPIFVLANLAAGVTSLIPNANLRYPGHIDPAPVATQIQTENVSSTVASPALLERLAGYCLSSQSTLPGLQKIFTGGAPVFPRLLDQLQNIAPNAHIAAVYGSTEAEPMAKIARCQITAEDRQAMFNGQGLLAGAPVERTHLKIMPDQWGTPIDPLSESDFAQVCLPPDQIGEIVVSGQHVLSGYLHGYGDEETKFLVDGVVWRRTGDAGYLDRQGRLWLLGRCAARIEDERGSLYPFAVECAVSQNPQVRRAAIVSHRGRRLLVVEPIQHSAPPNLTHLKDALAWAHIDEVRLFKHLPVDKRHNAKLDYPALQRLLARTV
jgi:acyl-CoA synthetase (AMP-forming)/AMP-acid ligase II